MEMMVASQCPMSTCRLAFECFFSFFLSFYLSFFLSFFLSLGKWAGGSWQRSVQPHDVYSARRRANDNKSRQSPSLISGPLPSLYISIFCHSNRWRSTKSLLGPLRLPKVESKSIKTTYGLLVIYLVY